jgi:signal transduction histidine kinase
MSLTLESSPPCGGTRTLPVDGESRLGLAIVHEINQPLAAISLHAAAARKWLCRAVPDVERALESLSLIGSAGRQATDTVRGLQRLAASLPAEMAAVDVDETVRETLLHLRHRLCEHRVEVELDLGLDARGVAANHAQLRQVLTNLLLNAIEAHAAAGLPGPRWIRIESRCQGSQAIELAVSDNGPGIDPMHHARVFTSPFSTKPGASAKAAGIGLSICLAIVRAHGGHAWFEACEPRGACFRVRLPMNAAHSV